MASVVTFLKSTRGYLWTKLFSKYYVNINCADAICSAFGHFEIELSVRIPPSSRSGQPVINLDSSSFFESTIAGSGSSYSIVSLNMSFDSIVVISTSFPSTTSLRSSQINHLRSFLCTLMLEVCPASSGSYQWPNKCHYSFNVSKFHKWILQVVSWMKMSRKRY